MSPVFLRKHFGYWSRGLQLTSRLCLAVLILDLVGCGQKQDAPAPNPPPTQPQPATQPQAQPATADTSAAQSLPVVDLHLANATLHTQIAATEAQREKGLMFCPKLADNDGMIFLLQPVGPASFWMKNTLIPLSVAFIDKDGVILEIHDMAPGDPNVPDDLLPVTHSASDQVAYALETNVHWFALNGIKPGDKLDPLPNTLAKLAAP